MEKLSSFNIFNKNKNKNKDRPSVKPVPESPRKSNWPTTSDLWYYFESISRKSYDVSYELVNSINKWLFDPQPTDPEEWKIWNERKKVERKKAAFDQVLGERNTKINNQYNEDTNHLKYKKTTCERWHSSSTTELNNKHNSDLNIYVPEQDWSNPSYTSGWTTEPFDHQYNDAKLCDLLECTPQSNLPEISDSSKKACRTEQFQVRDLQRQLELNQKSYDREYDNLVKYFEKEINRMKESCESGSGPRGFLELPGSLPVPNNPPLVPAAAVERMIRLKGFWSFLNFPINIARGEIFHLTVGRNYFGTAIYAFFELLIAMTVLLVYAMIAYMVWQLLNIAFETAKNSTQQWAENRKREAEYSFEERRRDDLARRRRKGRREFGRNLNHALDGPLKKAASIFKTIRGGYQGRLVEVKLPPIPFYALEMDPAHLTEWEKQQILFACDNIHSIIQFEKLRLEARRILESCKPSEFNRPLQRDNELKSTGKSGSVPLKRKRLSFSHRLQDEISAGLGAITLFTAVCSSWFHVPESALRYPASPISITQIEQPSNRPNYYSLTSEKKLGVVHSEQELNVQEIEELAEEAIVEKEKVNLNKAKRKQKKFNRRINTLDTIKKEDATLKCVYTVQEDKEGRIIVKRTQDDDVEKLIIELPSRKSNKSK